MWAQQINRLQMINHPIPREFIRQNYQKKILVYKLQQTFQCLSVILGINAIDGNTVIIITLHKETLVHNVVKMNSEFLPCNNSSVLADFNFSHRKSPSGQLLMLSTSINMTPLNKYIWHDGFTLR